MQITAEHGTVCVSVADGIADVRLNRPEKLNAITDDMFVDLLTTGLRLRAEPGVRAAVLSGAGRSFCAGLDRAVLAAMARGGNWRPRDAESLHGLHPDDPLVPLTRGQRASRVWATMPFPVVAAVHGHALGGGLQLILGADLRIVAPDAVLGVFELRWGIVPDMSGTQILPRLVGPDVAKDLVLTARTVDGTEALRIGLATRVADDPHAEALAVARAIAAHNPDAVREARTLVDLAAHTPLPEGLAAERAAMWRVVGTANQREAVRARLEERAPVFD